MSSPTPITNKAVRQISAIRIEELNDAQRLAKMPIYEAGLAWLETRRPFLSERSCSDYQKYIRKIADFFGDLPLEQLANPDLIRAYQIERGKGCGPGIINHECSIIQQLLKRIRKWADVAPFYEPIPLPRESPGRALTPDEEKRLLEVGSINPIGRPPIAWQ